MAIIRFRTNDWTLKQLMTALQCLSFLVNSLVIADPDSGDGYTGMDEEYCIAEDFEAKCDEEHVIFMKSALYGRMRQGRCIQRTFGEMGCFGNVLSIADQRCSGRRHCKIPVPDKEILDQIQCSSQLVMYFQASYTCVKVHQNLPSNCASSIPQLTTTTSGYIVHTGSPSSKCAWTIRLSAGLRINVTLLDFATARHVTTPGGSVVQPLECYMYAFIKEQGTTKAKICSGADRERVVYLSDTNTIEIETLPVRENTGRGLGGAVGGASGGVGGAGRAPGGDHAAPVSNDYESPYILKYEAVGCADLVDTSGHVIVHRPERDRLIVSCDNASKPHELICQNGEWNGTKPVCSQHISQIDPSATFWSRITTDWAHAILITVAIGMTLGIVIGVALLVTLMAYLKRKDRHKSIRDESLQHPHYHQQQQALHPAPAPYYSRSVRSSQDNSEVQIYYERSRKAFEPEVKCVAPPGELVKDTWLLMGHSVPTEDFICSCPTSGKQLVPSPGNPRVTERPLVSESHFTGRKTHQVAMEHVYEMTC